MKDKYKSLFSNTILFALGSFGSKFILFFLVPLYTNVLNKSEYGITELVITGSNLIIPFLTLSINDSVLRFCLDKKIDNRQVLKNSCLILSISTIIIVSLKPVIMRYNTFEEFSGYFVLIIILQMFRSMFSLYLKSNDKVKIFAIDNIIYTIVLAIMNVVMLIILRMGIDGYFIAVIVSTLFSILFQLIYGNIMRDFINSSINYKLMNQMIRYSTPLIANAVSWWFINSSDRFMINYFCSEADVGLYSVAAKIPSLVTSVLSVFIQAWIISAITEYEENKDKMFFEKIFSIYSNVMILLSSLFMIFTKPFMNIYVGKAFIEGWIYVPYLLLGAIFNSYTAFFTTIYKSAKKNVREMIITLFSASLNIIINLILIPKYGVLGAVIATMSSNIIIALFCMFDTRRYFSFPINFKKLFISFGILISQCILISLDIYSIYIYIIFLVILLIINYSIIKTSSYFLLKHFKNI